MRMNRGKIIVGTIDFMLAAYLAIAFVVFDKPDQEKQICTQVNINIADEATNGFITAKEIKGRLKDSGLYPLGKPLYTVDTRTIEEMLKRSPFVQSAQCYKTQDGHVCVTLTQRMPTLRIKSINGDDYYLDDNNSIMPNSHYTSDLIIATGHINKWFARNYVAYVGEALMANDFWKNQIEQINILPDKGIELVPRVGDQIIYIGQLPETNRPDKRKQLVTDYIDRKMDRLEKFYKYGLSQAGWNKYSYINVEFDNQIICKKRQYEKTEELN